MSEDVLQSEIDKLNHIIADVEKRYPAELKDVRAWDDFHRRQHQLRRWILQQEHRQMLEA